MFKYHIALFLLCAGYMNVGDASAQAVAAGTRNLESGARIAAAADATPLFVFALGSGTLARLNLATGCIQYCALTTVNGSSTSQCVKVGSIATDDLANAQMTVVPGHIVI